MTVKHLRKINFFEVVLLFVGLGVGIVGFFMITNYYQNNPLITWDLFQTIFLWLILIVSLILAATMEDVKEELGVIMKDHIEETKILKDETKILRDISHNQLTEIRLLRNEISLFRKDLPFNFATATQKHGKKSIKNVSLKSVKNVPQKSVKIASKKSKKN